MTTKIVDLFAGPGGWDLAAHSLGFKPLGIEYDDAAVETRRAAGLLTLQDDIAVLDPRNLPCDCEEPTGHNDAEPIHGADCPVSFEEPEGLIASPPCPTFSMAGKGGGRQLTEIIERCLTDLAVGIDNRQQYRDDSFYILEPAYWEDEQAQAKRKGREPSREKSAARARRDADMSILVCEPLRWVVESATDPEWIACEQVETVRPIWLMLAGHLQKRGYYTWTGIISSEQYGVAQTRRRAFCLARKIDAGKPLMMPKPTHQRYVAPQIKRHEKQEDSLFDGGDRSRIVHPDDRQLEPWLSMAECLGWAVGGMVGFPRRADTPSNKAGDGIIELGGIEYRERDLRDVNDPAQAVTEKARSWQRWSLRNGNQPNAAVRSADEPAATVAFGNNATGIVWIPDAMDQRGQKDGRTGEPNRSRSIDEPAATIAGETRNNRWVGGDPPKAISTGNFTAVERDPDGQRSKAGSVPYEREVTEPAPTVTGAPQKWVGERPATTVAGDNRIAEPGQKKNADNPDAPGRSTNAVLVTVEEAAQLQSFPPGYPWSGSNSKQFEQIGNAVPPLMARAVLQSILS